VPTVGRRGVLTDDGSGRLRILVLGATGMLGNAMFRVLAQTKEHEVFGTTRGVEAWRFFDKRAAKRLMTGVDVNNHDSIVQAFATLRPQVVINCIGLVKQLAAADDPLQAVSINALLPHRLASLCEIAGARLVHVSTDCVFSGTKGGYLETDIPDAWDLYGRTKLLGEVDYPHAITLRTSIIGHELSGCRSLVDWFLAQQGSVSGFTRAFFSGLPTVELSRVVRDVVLSNPRLHGLYHVAAERICKFDLLKMVAEIYGKSVNLISDDRLVIDRSLNASRFRKATGYVAPAWPELVRQMHECR
jgi:dTDP-4-dehydrorhamnose reductase